MPRVRKVNVIPKIVPKFLVPKYSLIIGARVGSNPARPKLKKMINKTIIVEELPPMKEKNNKPILVKTLETANMYFLGNLSASHP